MDLLRRNVLAAIFAAGGMVTATRGAVAGTRKGFGASPEQSGGTPADPASHPDAAAIQYRQGRGPAFLRGVGDRLDDDRHILDFIPYERHADIRAGTSGWDAAAPLNQAILDLGGRDIDFSGAARIAIGEPIKLVRGTVLRSNAGMDDSTSRGSTIYLLNGANSPILLSPVAAGSGVAHNYCRLEGLIFDGNAVSQQREQKAGAIQWWGEFIGSEICRCLISNTFGPGLTLARGSDVRLSHVWLLRQYLPQGGYALDTNMELTGDARSGLITFDHLFVELPRNSLAQDPKMAPSVRAAAIRWHRCVSVTGTRCHTEAAIHGTALESCQSVNILEHSGAWMGNGGHDDALVSILDDQCERIRIGGGNAYGGRPPRTYDPLFPVRKRQGLASRHFPDMPPALMGGSFGEYSAVRQDVASAAVQPPTAIREDLQIVDETGTGVSRLGLGSRGTGERGAFVWSGLRSESGSALVDYGSSKNQPGGTWKAFLRLISEGRPGDAVALLVGLTLARVSSVKGWRDGTIAMVGDTDGLARPQLRVGGRTLHLDLLQLGEASPIGKITPVHPQRYRDTVAGREYISVGNRNTDWVLLN